MYHFEIPKELRGRTVAVIIQDANEVLTSDFDGTLVAVGIMGAEGPRGFMDLLIMLKLEPDGGGRKEEGE